MECILQLGVSEWLNLTFSRFSTALHGCGKSRIFHQKPYSVLQVFLNQILPLTSLFVLLEFLFTLDQLKFHRDLWERQMKGRIKWHGHFLFCKILACFQSMDQAWFCDSHEKDSDILQNTFIRKDRRIYNVKFKEVLYYHIYVLQGTIVQLYVSDYVYFVMVAEQADQINKKNPDFSMIVALVIQENSRTSFF
ncbi:hypothetical protein F4703DRAFT_1918647 [Phycomyces blakesleeanus]